MNRPEEIKRLKAHIQNLKEELRSINFKQPKLSADDYLKLLHRHKTLQNLLCIASNELYALLNLYSVSLSGEIIDKNGQVIKKNMRVKFYTDVDCCTKPKVRLEYKKPGYSRLIRRIKENFSARFLEGKFEISTIKQLR